MIIAIHEVLKNKIDQHLRKLNDDYATERDSALKEVFLEVIAGRKIYEIYGAERKAGQPA